MKLLMEHVERASVLSRAWVHGVRKWTVEKLNDMYSNIAYKFRLIEKNVNQRKHEAITWKSYLKLILESKGLLGPLVYPIKIGV